MLWACGYGHIRHQGTHLYLNIQPPDIKSSIDPVEDDDTPAPPALQIEHRAVRFGIEKSRAPERSQPSPCPAANVQFVRLEHHLRRGTWRPGSYQRGASKMLHSHYARNSMIQHISKLQVHLHSIRKLTVSSPILAKQLPPRLKISDADLTISYLKGSGPGGQKIVSCDKVQI